MKKPLSIFTMILLLSLNFPAPLLAAVRYAYVSGAFYPADKEELGSMIDGFLARAPEEKTPSGAALQALIVPHAGYIYSGQTAAYAYKLLLDQHFDTVVLVGPYHKGIFNGTSVWKSGKWQTPLGDVVVDEDLAGAIAVESSVFNFTEDAHATEHSLEVQIPFLQKVLKGFKIVPILISDPSPDNTQELARAIYKHIQGKKVLVVASTDMSHYYEDAAARQMDSLTRGLLQKKDTTALLSGMENRKTELCGIAATMTVLELSKLMGDTEVRFLNYSNTSDSTGDKSRVVGYGAFAIYKGSQTRAAAETPNETLSQDQGKELLRIARQTVEGYVSTGKAPEFTVTDPALEKPGAAFVTLKEHGDLRGCIGSLAVQEPLYLSVRNMAVQSASHDPRFKPVRPEELKDIQVEISVLSSPKKTRNADDIVMGRDGVILKNSFASGVFLPKVATETGWSKEEFLSELCSQKAGLPRDCWQDPATEIYTFQSQDFTEK